MSICIRMMSWKALVLFYWGLISLSSLNTERLLGAWKRNRFTIDFYPLLIIFFFKKHAEKNFHRFCYSSQWNYISLLLCRIYCKSITLSLPAMNGKKLASIYNLSLNSSSITSYINCKYIMLVSGVSQQPSESLFHIVFPGFDCFQLHTLSLQLVFAQLSSFSSDRTHIIETVLG